MRLVSIFSLAFLVFSCSEPETASSISNDPDEALTGGATTSFDQTSKAYTFPLANISATNLVMHDEGDAAFEDTFVSPPALINGGLGPLFNNTSCVSCHNNDGRAKAPADMNSFGGLLFRISGQDRHEPKCPDR